MSHKREPDLSGVELCIRAKKKNGKKKEPEQSKQSKQSTASGAGAH